MRIMLDPGHGLPDPGAVGPSGLQEAQVTLSVARLLAVKLQASGWNVKLTRTRPQAPTHPHFEQGKDLAYRVNWANSWPAQLYLSIHCNAAPAPTAGGTETLVAPQASDASRRLARLLQAHLLAALGLQDRGIKEQDVYVLRRTRMPAVLVELAFISNPVEEALLASLDTHQRVAEALVLGLEDYRSGREQP